jgi:hypothetical protein
LARLHKILASHVSRQPLHPNHHQAKKGHQVNRLDPSELRVIRSYRLTPDTAATIAELSADSGLSQGQIVDRLVAFYDKHAYFSDMKGVKP